MNRERLIYGAMLAVVLAPGVSLAQQRKLSADLAMTVTQDSNVARLNPAVAQSRGIRLEDTIYKPELVLDYYLPVGRQAVFLSGTAGYMSHQSSKLLDRATANLRLGAAGQVGVCSVSPTAEYQRATQEVQDVDLSDTYTAIRSKEALELGVVCAGKSGLGAIVNGGRTWSKTDDPKLRDTESVQTQVTAGVSYGRPSAGSVSLFATRARVEFPNRPVTNGQKDGYDQTGAGLTVTRRLGARIQGSATVSYVVVDPLAVVAGKPDASFEGLNYQADVSYKASSRLQMAASFERGVAPSQGVRSSNDLRTKSGASLRYKVSSRLALSLSGTRSEVDSRGSTAPVATTVTNSKITTINGGLEYRQSDRVTVRLDATHVERATNLLDRNYDADRIGVTLNVKLK